MKVFVVTDELGDVICTAASMELANQAIDLYVEAWEFANAPQECDSSFIITQTNLYQQIKNFSNQKH